MTTAPPNPPNHQGALEKLRFFARYLIEAIVAISHCNRIHPGPASRINEQISAFTRRVQRLIARLAAGTYKPRPKTGPRKIPIPKRVKQPGEPPRKKRGWLGDLLVEWQGHRGSLDRILRDTDMVALIEAAPAEMARPLRSLCFMLGLPAPPILARPRTAKPPDPGPTAEIPQPEARAPLTGSEILTSPSAPAELRAKWAKPRGSLSNRLYRKRPPPRPGGAKNSA